jgi:hypothetical protein
MPQGLFSLCPRTKLSRDVKFRDATWWHHCVDGMQWQTLSPNYWQTCWNFYWWTTYWICPPPPLHWQIMNGNFCLWNLWLTVTVPNILSLFWGGFFIVILFHSMPPIFFVSIFHFFHLCFLWVSTGKLNGKIFVSVRQSRNCSAPNPYSIFVQHKNFTKLHCMEYWYIIR